MTSAREAVARAICQQEKCAASLEACSYCGPRDKQVLNQDSCWNASDAALTAILTWLSSNGLVIVPKEPTTEMLSALWSAVNARPWVESGKTCYRAMLSAAPQPDLGK